MIKSMTGFGRAEVSNDDYKICVEMKSVNHRYLDLGIKMPKKFNCFEADIRSLMKTRVARGKVDVFITLETFSDKAVKLNYNEALAAEYMKIFERMSEQFEIKNDITVASLSRFPDIISSEQTEEDEEALWALLKEALEGAIDKFVDQRIREGELLREDIINKLDSMLVWVAEVEERSPQIIAEYRAKLEQKVKEFLENASIDENRIAAEVTMFSDKICVDEEIVRLRAHINTMKKELMKGEAVGRKLDFIAQEMNREANTTLSKANDLTISDTAISLKTEIEKVREQIQNIE